MLLAFSLINKGCCNAGPKIMVWGFDYQRLRSAMETNSKGELNFLKVLFLFINFSDKGRIAARLVKVLHATKSFQRVPCGGGATDDADKRGSTPIEEKSCFLETTYIWTALGYRWISPVNVEKFDDKYFGKKVEKKKTKGGGMFFEVKKEAPSKIGICPFGCRFCVAKLTKEAILWTSFTPKRKMIPIPSNAVGDYSILSTSSKFNEFSSFEEVLKLYKGGLPVRKSDFLESIREKIPFEFSRELFRSDGEHLSKFPVPQVTQGTLWKYRMLLFVMRTDLVGEFVGYTRPKTRRVPSSLSTIDVPNRDEKETKIVAYSGTMEAGKK
ncbi:hypothetical protein L1887_08282 [Cichorium endivia]|nr:hypothetical protein L1887_08282 [Cichorium endivia]